jgi:hypothetical protein
MAITNINGSAASYPATVERRADNDGSAGFWDATIVPLVDRTAYLYDQLIGATNGLAVKLASQAVGVFGTYLVGQRAVVDANQGTLAAGTLLSAIQALWIGKAGISGTNIFTGPRSRSGTNATDAERVNHLASNGGAFSFATAHDMIWVDMADGLAGTSHVWTASDTGSVLNAKVDLAVFTPTLGHTITVKRDDASTICTFGNGGLGGFATIKFLADTTYPAGRWRLTSASGDVVANVPV